MRRRALVIAAIGLVGLAYGVSGNARSSCPTNVLTESASAPVGVVLRAAERRLAKRTMNTQGTIYHLTPRNAPIELVARLATGAPVLEARVPGLAALHHAAAVACGERTAGASWAIRYD